MELAVLPSRNTRIPTPSEPRLSTFSISSLINFWVCASGSLALAENPYMPHIASRYHVDTRVIENTLEDCLFARKSPVCELL